MPERKIYDITLPLTENITNYGGDKKPVFSTAARTTGSFTITTTTIALSVHTGTHVDSPKHMDPQGDGIDLVPLEVLVGSCAVVEVSGDVSSITAEFLAKHEDAIAKHKRVLFKTRDSCRWADAQHEFIPDYVYLAGDAASWLVQRQVKLVGIDYLSVDPYMDEEMPAHVALLKAGIAIVESCDLQGVPPGEYELICLPLRLVGLDGSPARAILRELA